MRFYVVPRKKRLDICAVDVWNLRLLLLVGHSRRTARRGFGGLLQTIIALVVLQIVLTVAAAIVNPKAAKAPRDERDKLIELRAMRVAYAGLATGIALACFFGAFNPPVIFNTNALLFILVTAEIMRSACQIVQYRREA
jgi:fatty acid desaturase